MHSSVFAARKSASTPTSTQADMTTIPETHHAVGQLAAGAPLTSFELPTPKPGRDQLLVRVLWAAVTSVNVWIVDFQLSDPAYPFVPGSSIAGEVVAVGEGLEHKVGDRILSFNFSDEASGKASQEYALLSKWNVGKVSYDLRVEWPS